MTTHALIIRLIMLLFASGLVAAMISKDWKVMLIPACLTTYILLAVGVGTLIGGGP